MRPPPGPAEDASALVVLLARLRAMLRRKIDLPFGRHAVQTVRRAGYRLATDGG